MQQEEATEMQRIEHAGAVFYMAGEDIVNDSHIEFMTVTRTDTGLRLMAQLSSEGAERLERMSEVQIGRHLGLLIGSSLVSAPRVVSAVPLPSNSVDIGILLGEGEVDQMVAALESRFEPVPGYTGSRSF